MHYQSNPNKRHRLAVAIATTSLLTTTGAALAQEETVEEVVVTGSYIRNSAFAEGANVATISQEDIYTSGAPSIGQYIRDLSFTQNVDTVANVNAGQDGGQDGAGASLIAGLGENSTLTLGDGVRLIGNAISTIYPDIALSDSRSSWTVDLPYMAPTP